MEEEMTWPRTREEMQALARRVNTEMFGDPALYPGDAEAWVRGTAASVRASIREGESLETCYSRMLSGIREDADKHFPNWGWALEFLHGELGFSG